MELRPGVRCGWASGTVKSSSHHYHHYASSHKVMSPLYCCSYVYTDINTASNVAHDMHWTISLKKQRSTFENIKTFFGSFWIWGWFVKKIRINDPLNITTRWVCIRTAQGHLLSTCLRLHLCTKVFPPLAMISILEKNWGLWREGKGVVCIFIAIIRPAPSSTQ